MAYVGGPSRAPGAPTVLIGGQPAARMGDQTAHGGIIALGCFTVLIGDSGGGGAGAAGAGPQTPHPCLRAAAAAGAPFVRTR